MLWSNFKNFWYRVYIILSGTVPKIVINSDSPRLYKVGSLDQNNYLSISEEGLSFVGAKTLTPFSNAAPRVGDLILDNNSNKVYIVRVVTDDCPGNFKGDLKYITTVELLFIRYPMLRELKIF